MIPQYVAMALQADGWYLRSDCIWAKPNPMPESVTDRPTKAHEYLFLLSKSERYFYDYDAVKEPASDTGRINGRDGRTEEAGARPPGSSPRTLARLDYTNLGRNRRSVWTVPTEPFNGKALMADYVGRDGKFYRASPDCPLHAPLAERRMWQEAAHGGQLGLFQNRNRGSDDRPASGQQASPVSTPSMRSGTPDPETRTPQTPENTVESRTSGPTLPLGANASSADAQTDPRIPRTPEPQVACYPDSAVPACSQTANGSSTGSHRTGPAAATIPPCTPCAQTPARTPGTLEAPASDALPQRTGESKTEGGSAEGAASAQTPDHNPGKSLSYPNGSAARCTCQEVMHDHFAVMPTALVEPCVLAGCPKDGTVLDPFAGAGTVLYVASLLGRHSVGIELNPDSAELAVARLNGGRRAHNNGSADAQPDLFAGVG